MVWIDHCDGFSSSGDLLYHERRVAALSQRRLGFLPGHDGAGAGPSAGETRAQEKARGKAIAKHLRAIKQQRKNGKP
jgi:hypothetical protein